LAPPRAQLVGIRGIPRPSAVGRTEAQPQLHAREHSIGRRAVHLCFGLYQKRVPRPALKSAGPRFGRLWLVACTASSPAGPTGRLLGDRRRPGAGFSSSPEGSFAARLCPRTSFPLLAADGAHAPVVKCSTPRDAFAVFSQGRRERLIVAGFRAKGLLCGLGGLEALGRASDSSTRRTAATVTQSRRDLLDGGAYEFAVDEVNPLLHQVRGKHSALPNLLEHPVRSSAGCNGLTSRDQGRDNNRDRAGASPAEPVGRRTTSRSDRHARIFFAADFDFFSGPRGSGKGRG